MESRGLPTAGPTPSRPAIARRSCDYCRARKVACDRGSPCSNCVSARLECVHSTIAGKTSTRLGQRVNITSQYERKIDEIAENVYDIKRVLETITLSAKPQERARPAPAPTPSRKTLSEADTVYTSVVEPEWDYSGNIIDFIRAVVNQSSPADAAAKPSPVISSLQRLLGAIENGDCDERPPVPSCVDPDHLVAACLPPMDAAVTALRWVKDPVNQAHPRMIWLSRVLPLDSLCEICKKVYFAVEEYSHTDFILTCGFLFLVFSEHITTTGSQDYQEYCQKCQSSLQNALARLPIVLTPSMEAVAALTIGAFTSVESFDVCLAWSFISMATNLCQTLGYNLVRPRSRISSATRTAQVHLFWTVYRLEKGLSLRLGRSSTIRDSDITLPISPEHARYSRLGSIEGKVWDHLYSPSAQTNRASRIELAGELATEIRGLIEATRHEMETTAFPLREDIQETVQDVYVQAELVCQSSVLALCLRASCPAGSVTVARECLDLHQRIIATIRASATDPSILLSRYLSWSVVHHPFVPFSIIFTNVFQYHDVDDLVRLEEFAASVKTEQFMSKAAANSYRLYDVLCQAARVYIEANPQSVSLGNQPSTSDTVVASSGYGSVQTGITDWDTGIDQGLGLGHPEMNELSDWYFGNQQLMSLLDVPLDIE